MYKKRRSKKRSRFGKTKSKRRGYRQSRYSKLLKAGRRA